MTFEKTNGIAAQPHGPTTNAPDGIVLFPDARPKARWASRPLMPVGRNSLHPRFALSTTLLAALPALVLAAGLVGCGGGSGGVTLKTGTPTVIAFSSSRALDGSDAVNTDQTNGLLPVFNIWTINSDGSGLTAITQLSGSAHGADSTDPQWSPDGTKILYSSGRALDGSDTAGAGPNLWVSNADGSGATPVTQLTVYAPCYGAVWSPDGTKIAYFSWRGLDGSNTNAGDENGTHNIWVVNADGSNDMPVTQLTAPGADSLYPVWSPDSTKLAFESGRALDGSNAGPGEYATQNVWVVNVDGSGATAVTQLAGILGSYQDPLWSKDGSTLIFNSDIPSPSSDDIFSAHPDGSGLTQLTHNGLTLNYATEWSPDGSTILYTSSIATDGSQSPGQSLNMWTMSADGSNQKPLTKLNNAGAFLGAWSSDGTRIAYLSDRAFDGSDSIDSSEDVANIWLMQADGTGSVALTKLKVVGSGAPAWKP
jgi:Tol biopolymer transport system component